MHDDIPLRNGNIISRNVLLLSTVVENTYIIFYHTIGKNFVPFLRILVVNGILE